MFACNDKISHIQLAGWMMLVYTGPVILWGYHGDNVADSLLGIMTAMAVTGVWCFSLLRSSHGFVNMEKYLGKYLTKMIMLVLYIYLIFTGAYLAGNVSALIGSYMIPGLTLSEGAFLFLCAGACVCHETESRGRLSQVLWPVVKYLIGIFLVLALFTGEADLNFILKGAGWSRASARGVLHQAQWIMFLMSGMIFLPFLYEKTQQQAEAGKRFAKSFLGMTALIMILTILYFLVLGTRGAQSLENPVLHVMGGIRLPGGFLKRFDLLFLSVVMFSLLSAMSSIFYMSSMIIREIVPCKKNRVVAFLNILAVLGIYLTGDRDIRYPEMVLKIFLPFFVALTICISFMRKGYKKNAVFCICMAAGIFFSGCASIEPEKRDYPLAAGIHYENERYEIILSMARIEESTGQGKTGGEQGDMGSDGVVRLGGKDKKEIIKEYDERYQLFLDPGHIQTVILSSDILKNDEMTGKILMEMERDPAMGTGAWVFKTDRPEDIFEFEPEWKISLGRYLSGMYENRVDTCEPVTVGKACREWNNQGYVENIPEIYVEENGIKVDKTGK